MNYNKKPYIVLAAGGTGGHVYPALSLIKKLENEFDYCLICDLRGKKFVKLQDKNININTIHSTRITGSKYIKKLYLMSQLIFSTLKILFSFVKKRPSIIVGFGGYPSFPTICAAIIARVPVVLHEQNAVIGQVNKLFLPFAKKLATSFEDTIGINNKYIEKLVCTGNPIREEFYKAASLLKKDDRNMDSNIRILVIGGSQGAKIFSDVIPDSIKNLNEDLQKRIVITQQVRKENMEQSNKVYNKTKCKFILKEFFDNIADLYIKNDLVISRSGASTIAELMVLNMPAILIPYAAAKNNHQFYNADYLVKRKKAIIIKQANFNIKSFTAILEDLFNKKILEDLRNNTTKQKINKVEKATDKLAELVYRQLKVKN